MAVSPVFVNDYFNTIYKTPEGAAYRKDNVISNLLDHVTGEVVSFIKVTKYFDESEMDDSKVDGFIYRKLNDEYFVDSEYLSTGIIRAQRFGVMSGGIQDNFGRFDQLFKLGFLGRIVFPAKKRYFLSKYISLSNSIDIDFNDCEIIAPTGIVNRMESSKVFTGQNYLTVKKNDMTFPKIAGITDGIKVGTLVLVRSLTPYWPLSNLYDGQLLVISKENADSFDITTPIYKTFQIDRIEIYDNASVKIQNLTLNMTGCIAAYKGFNLFCFKEVEFSNVKAFGSDAAACGAEIVADRVVIRDSEAHGFLNVVGTGEGRMGYGFAANGNNVNLANIKGSRCKHIVSCNHRTVMTIYFRIAGFYGANPANEFSRLGDLPGHGTLYQAAVDIHPNCVNAFLDDVNYDGCNGAMTIRNGNATINSPKIRSRSASDVSNNTSLIDIYEHSVESIIINNPEIYIDDPITGQTDIISLLGFRPAISQLDNGNIIVNNLYQQGGKLFTMYVTNAESNGVTFKSIIFNNVIAKKLDSGITISGNSRFRIGAIEKLRLTGDITISSTSGMSKELVNIEFIDRIDYVDCYSSKFNCEDVKDAYAFRLLMSENSMPPLFMDFSQSTWKAGAGCFAFIYNFSNNRRGWGKARFDNTTIDFNLNAGNNQTFIIGIYNQSLSHFDDEWTFDGCKITNSGSVKLTSQNECLRFPARSKLNVDNIMIQGSILIADDSYFRERAALGDVPYNIKTSGGYFPYLNFRIKDRRFFVASVVQLSAGTAGALPKYPPLFDNQIVYNEAFNGIAPYAWIGFEGKWQRLFVNSS